MNKYLSMLRGIHKHNLLRVLAPPPLAAAVVLLEPVVEVAEPAESTPSRRNSQRPRPEQLAAKAAASQAAAPRLRGGRA